MQYKDPDFFRFWLYIILLEPSPNKDCFHPGTAAATTFSCPVVDVSRFLPWYPTSHHGNQLPTTVPCFPPWYPASHHGTLLPTTVLSFPPQCPSLKIKELPYSPLLPLSVKEGARISWIEKRHFYTHFSSPNSQRKSWTHVSFSAEILGSGCSLTCDTEEHRFKVILEMTEKLRVHWLEPNSLSIRKELYEGNVGQSASRVVIPRLGWMSESQ